MAEALARRAPTPNAVMPSGELGMLLFIMMETMFFAGLISAFIVLRAGAGAMWPPPDQPRLPVSVTAFNTLLLLLSGVAMGLAAASVRRRTGRAVAGWLIVSAVLGAGFLAVQGIEWVRLVSYGLTVTSSLYGSTFYVLIGAHGLHVAGGLVGLLVLLVRVLRSTGAIDDRGPRLCRMYWWFVVGIWPVLYLLVYF